MDIRPVDVQMFINKSSSTTRLENNDQRGFDQNMLFSEQMKKNIDNENNKTISSNKSEQHNINKDGSNKQGKGKGKKRNKNNKKNENMKNTKKSSISFLDISI